GPGRVGGAPDPATPWRRSAVLECSATCACVDRAHGLPTGPGGLIVRAKITVPDIQGAKGTRRLTMVTAYDCTFAQLIDRAGVDIRAVGDSLGMVVQGEQWPLPVTLEEMISPVRLVARAKTSALVLGDLPFLSYQTSRRDALESAGRLLKVGAEAVKLEGG